jgi:RimJ/RimL family protein N-acetyltransferase
LEYPKEWERHLTLTEGTPIFVRPIRPEDEQLYGTFLAATTADDVRLRFFAPVNLSEQQIFRFTHLDYDRAMAFIALDRTGGEMLGVARLHADTVDGKSGEYAIIIRSDLKGHGLGWTLMHLIIEYAQAKHMRDIHAQVLRENVGMLKMCAELGFAIEDDPSVSYICNVRLDLSQVS